MSQDEMLTPPEVAEYFKVPVQTVWRWFRNGTLPAVKIGRHWRIRRDKLSAFIEAKEAALVARETISNYEERTG